MYQNQKDETLVMLTLAGEQNAYGELVARYEKAVIASAASVTHNRHMAEDSAQDAFITAWIKLNMLREPDKYGAWVCRIAKNCAKNTVMRFQSFISLDDPDKPVYEICDNAQSNLQDTYELSEEHSLLRESIEKLPEKVKRIIHLHYFEDLSVSEIAEKTGISEGTVKWHLHDGRKRIRKELCAMNEEYNDTMVQRVMKKVEELKLWQYKNSKNGFEKVYKEVLKEVEELPESMDKYHALADVLMRGWWWISGEKNDALFDRIREAAEKGKNDEVMEFIAAKEDEKLYGGAKIEFIRKTQIPRLEKSGFVKALAAEWNWLAYTYFEQDEPEKGFEAYENGLKLLKPSDLYYSYIKGAMEAEKKYLAEYKNDKFKKWHSLFFAGEYSIADGKLRRWDSKFCYKGGLTSEDIAVDHVFYNASLCDGFFTVEGLKKGERYVGSDGTTLEYTEDNVSVTTPCGNFEGCKLWTVNHERAIYKTYYKEEIGIVKFERSFNGFSETRTLLKYDILGGNGIIPLHEGNKWSYTANCDPDFIKQATECEVVFAGDKTAVLSCKINIERIAYNENSWHDMITQIRNDYCVGTSWHENKIADVSFPIKRARELAKTNVEKAHTKAACSVAERILATDPEFNPDYTEKGLWNFFQCYVTYKQGDKAVIINDRRHAFEWKHMSDDESEYRYPLLFNHIYGILHDATGCIWCDKWKDGYKAEFTTTYDDTVIHTTRLSCENAGTVETKAGSFENCLKIALDIDKYGEFIEYRSGKKEYYFATGIGIVKIVHHYMEDMLTCVYELSFYEGRGEGYMPVADGLVRKYEAVGLTDGFVAGAEYTYAADKDGQIYIFEDNLGIRKKPQVYNSYPATYGEELEEKLWLEGRQDMGNIRHDLLDQSRLRHDINNFNLFLHFLDQNDRSWYLPERKTSQAKHKMRLFEALNENGSVPKAWLGAYARQCFIAGCSMLGSGNREEGYPYLDRAFELFKEWDAIPDGELLETGDKFIFGGIKIIKGKQNVIVLPDGTKEVIREESFYFSLNGVSFMYNGMTALHGWEWFNGVREEERFKEILQKVKEVLGN